MAYSRMRSKTLQSIQNIIGGTIIGIVVSLFFIYPYITFSGWLTNGILVAFLVVFVLGDLRKSALKREYEEMRCLDCGYDLRGHQPACRCPECGWNRPEDEGKTAEVVDVEDSE